MSNDLFPPLPLQEWEDTKITLHLYAQIVGKIRLALSPYLNHWWQVPFYVSARGITTSPIPYQGRIFEIEFDLIEHQLIIRSSKGAMRILALGPRSVGDFYQEVIASLQALGIEVDILAKPFDHPSKEPFATDTRHASYDAEYVNRFWRILVQVDTVLKDYRGRFKGKSSPVHLFWHSFDLAVTRFSGHSAPVSAEADPVTREAYSHEVISCGFWPGDANVRAPAFYSYAWPEPPGLRNEPLRPGAAFWGEQRGSTMALLMYDELLKTGSPQQALLDFVESAYRAGAKLAGWDREALEHG